MSTSLFTGLSGLRSYETYLDVIGNNISNANTTGFRGSRVTFGDLLSITTSPASAPTATLGGKNPTQVGLGVGVKSVDMNTNAGSLVATDRNLDLTIFGAGFFVLNDGAQNVYTRAGTFGFDANGTLVELGSGFRVQSAAGQSIVVEPNSIAPPKATTQIDVKGNLPATVTGPLEEILTSNNPFQTGTGATVTGTAAEPFAFTAGDSFSVSVDGGVVQTITFAASDFTAIGANIASATAAEVAQVINTQLAGATASASSGSLVITSDTIGSASKLKITDVSGSPAFTLGLSTILTEGTETAATGSLDLNDLVTTQIDYVNGDGIEVRGSDMNGDEFGGTFIYGVDGTTLEDLRAYIANLVPDATVTIDVEGNMVLTGNTPGESEYSLTLEDPPGNTGSSDFNATAFVVTQDGTPPDSVNTAITIYDKNGEPHVVSLTFEREDAASWKLTASLPDADGTLLDNEVGNIRFDQDGSLIADGGPGDEDLNIEIQFAIGQQDITLNLGSLGGIDGLTQFGGPATAQATNQDGFGAGTLTDVLVSQDGSVLGVFTNGQTQNYGQIGVASFANPGGLRRDGSNMFSATTNSGVPLISNGGGPGGFIQAGVLETSNVDLAEEFVRLIEAQRGYQASARIIRASEELLQSLLQNI